MEYSILLPDTRAWSNGFTILPFQGRGPGSIPGVRNQFSYFFFPIRMRVRRQGSIQKKPYGYEVFIPAGWTVEKKKKSIGTYETEEFAQNAVQLFILVFHWCTVLVSTMARIDKIEKYDNTVARRYIGGEYYQTVRCILHVSYTLQTALIVLRSPSF